ncbi:MAG: DMT family transporter [Chloroflexi bacterium]|nr:DMT family transporter [Chloroflexota bacterium]
MKFRVPLVLALILAAAAIAPICVRRAQLAGIPSPLIVWLRLALTTAVITPFAWRREATALRQLRRRELLLSLVAGFWLVCNLLLFFVALEHTNVFVTTVLRRTTPLWTALPEVWLLGVVFPRRLWWGIAITLLGGAIVAASGGSAGEVVSLGALIALLGATCEASYLFLGRFLSTRLTALAYSWLVFAWGALISSAVLWLLRIPLGGHSLAGYGWALSVVVIGQLIGHLAINWSVGRLHATTLSLVMQLSVVLSGLLAWLWLAELPLPGEALGSLVVLVGVALATLRRPLRRPLRAS